MSKLSNEDLITAVKLSLYRGEKTQWYSYITMNTNISRDDQRVPTMAITETLEIYYNDNFVNEIIADDKTALENMKFVLVHEILHPIMQSFSRRGNRSWPKWNIATDLVNNWLLVSDGFTFTPNSKWTQPWNQLVPEKDGKITLEKNLFGGKKDIVLDISKMNAEAVYDALPELPSEGENEGDDNKRARGGFDEHIEDEECKNDTAKRVLNERKIGKKVTDAMTAQKMRGQGSSVMDRIAAHIREPELNWRTLLHRYISQDIICNYTWRTPGKRFQSTGVYLPRTLRENIEVYVAVDTSGSIAHEEYSKFISECLGMCRAFDQIKLHVIYWADGIDEKDSIDVEKCSKDKLIKHYPRNSGGTNLSCVNEYMKKKRLTPQVVIYFTDGHVEPKPVLYPSNIVVISKGGSDSILKKKSKKIVQLRGE